MLLEVCAARSTQYAVPCRKYEPYSRLNAISLTLQTHSPTLSTLPPSAAAVLRMSASKPALQRGSSEGGISDSTMYPYIKFSIENIEPYYLPPDLEEIARQPLPRYDFHTEVELLKKYEEIRFAEQIKATPPVPLVSNQWIDRHRLGDLHSANRLL